MRAACVYVLLLLGAVAGKRRDGKRKSDADKYKTLPNVCDRDNRESPFVCTCDNDGMSAATTANCWVLPQLSPNSVNTLPWSQFTSQTNLQDLKLSCRSQSNLNEFPTDLLRIERKLEVLEMQYGNVREVFGYALNNASYVREVKLSRNNISVLHPHAFAYLNSLESLNLDDNLIFELQPMAFHHLPNLRKMFLARNNLTIVHDNAFRFLNHLHELDLSGNGLSILTRETFNGLFRLQRLDLNINRLTMLGDLTFAEMPKLRELELEGNALVFISDQAFVGLKELHRLRLTENKLKSLSDRTFLDTPNIQFLDLRDNGMQELKFTTLEPLWESFKNLSTHLLLEGNEFPCNCHLSWVYSLREETPNKQVRNSLEELTCILPEDMLAEHEPAVIHSSEQQDDQFAGNGLDSDGDSDGTDVVEYEDDGVEYGDLPEEGGPPKKRVVDIVPADLPCPESLQAQTEVPPQANELPKPEGAGSSGIASGHHVTSRLFFYSCLLSIFLYSLLVT